MDACPPGESPFESDVGVEIIIRLLVDVVAVNDTYALRCVLGIGLLRDIGQFLLTAAVIAHQHDVPEAVADQLFGNFVVDLLDTSPA